ncbi:MAG: HDOD domain-containing protein [Pseudomonadota bacterium]
MSDVYFARQPVYDLNERVVANELLFRPADGETFDGDMATARVLMAAMVDLDFESVSVGKPVLINLTRPFLTGEYQLPMAPDQVILEVLETVHVDDAVRRHVKNLVDRGFTVALDDFEFGQSTEQLLPLAQLVKLDVLSMTPEQVEDHVHRLRDQGKRLLAEKVETKEHFDHCRSLGFEWYQGYFLSRPELVSGKAIPDSFCSALQLMNELGQPDADVDQIEQLIQRDVGLSYRLLRYINSSFFGFASPINSIRHALVMMGLNEIRRWASLLTLAGMKSEPVELLRESLQRARMCEMLATATNQPDPGRFFTTGLFSQLDVLLAVPMPEVLSALPLAEEFTDALESEAGICGEALKCCRAYERGAVQDATFQALAFDDVRTCYLDSLRWSDEAIFDLVAAAGPDQKTDAA